tara:strand:- start:5609 stop:5881 length:273 start_codon:yes stop_codon:yes gene_type:complete
MDVVYDIRSKFRDQRISKDELKNMYADFVEQKPQLFDMICSHNCDDIMLNKMLKLHSKVTTGELSQHDASVKVGQHLVDKYVVPEVEKNK